MRSPGPIIFCCIALIISVSAQGGHMSEQRRQYEYQRSFSGGGGSASAVNGCSNCQLGSHGPMGSTWLQQQREEMQRRAEHFRKQFQSSVGSGMTSSHYQKYHSTGATADCKDHGSSSVHKVQEHHHVVPPPVVHNVRKFEESRNSHQVRIPEGAIRMQKLFEEQRRQQVVPVGGHSSRYFEEQHRQVHQPPPVVTQYHKKFEEERRNVLRPPPITYRVEKKVEERKHDSHQVVLPAQTHVSKLTESHQTGEQIPVYGNSYFSISQAERHRQHAKPFPQIYTQHQLVETSSQRTQPVYPKENKYFHEEHYEKVQQQQPVVNVKKVEKMEEHSFRQPSIPTFSQTHQHVEDSHHQVVTHQQPVTHIVKEIEIEDTQHYNKQYEKKKDEVHYEYERITFPSWVQKQSDRLIYEEYYRQCVTPQEYGRNLTRSEEERFYEYYNQQGGTTLEEIKETLKQQIVYPSYLITTEEKKIFEEFYLSRVGLINQARNLTSHELKEFEEYYQYQLGKKIQETEDIYQAQHYNLQYPTWMVTETDKKIFEEYYFAHVPESEYGRELTKDERVEFEVYYTENGGMTDHVVETYDHTAYRIVYPDWVTTTEDRAIYEEYYRLVVGESYGRELTQQELYEFEEYYRTHGGTTQHQGQEDVTQLSYKIVYPSWIVSQVDKVIFEEFYRIHVQVEEYGRELTTEELLLFEEYYKQRGGNSRKVLEETLFMRLSYPTWCRTEYERSMYREFYLRQVYVEDYGRFLTDEEQSQFVEYYNRHTKGQYETLRGEIDYQWVYPSFVVTRNDRRIFNAYYNQCMRSKLDLGRELTETEKIEFQQYFIEQGGLYEYKYTREEYLLTFELDRKIGGTAYQWTWDGFERMAAELTNVVAPFPDVHHTDNLDKKIYGSTKEEEEVPTPPPAVPTTTEKPKRKEISKDRGDQPPQQYEDEVEPEPGIVPHEPVPAPIVHPSPRPCPTPTDTSCKFGRHYEHHEEHSAPVGYTEYRRRYEHQRTQSRVVPDEAPLTYSEDLGHTGAQTHASRDYNTQYGQTGSSQYGQSSTGYHSTSSRNHQHGHTESSQGTNYNTQHGHGSTHHRTSSASNTLDGDYELIHQDMKPEASSHNSHRPSNPDSIYDNIGDPDLLTEDEYENVDLEYPEDQRDQQRKIN